MYHQVPLVIEVSITTGAIHTPVVHPIIAAPGAGQALRISQITAAVADNSTGVIELFSVGDGAGVVGIWNCNVGVAIGSSAQAFPEPGVQLGVNKQLQLTSRGSVATQSVQVTVLYYIDQVS